jgi:hypothetical protein
MSERLFSLRIPEFESDQPGILNSPAAMLFGLPLGQRLPKSLRELHIPSAAARARKVSGAPRRKDCAPVAGKSTLNRLELSRTEPTRYHKIAYDQAAIEALAVDLFLEAHEPPLTPVASCGTTVSALEEGEEAESGTSVTSERLQPMFLFFSNGVGLTGSIVASLLLTLVLMYACSGP